MDDGALLVSNWLAFPLPFVIILEYEEEDGADHEKDERGRQREPAQIAVVVDAAGASWML